MIPPNEHQILFKPDMIRAILNCKPNVWPAKPIDADEPFKWQTRRVIKPQPLDQWYDYGRYFNEKPHEWNCPYGEKNHGLWPRETWRVTEADHKFDIADLCQLKVHYPADDDRVPMLQA